jgi:DNA-binding transcriptional ArsR family regulator
MGCSDWRRDQAQGLSVRPGRTRGNSIVDSFERICLYKGVLDGAVLNALADPRRQAILRLVRDIERPAGEIAAHFPDVTGPAISQHLRVLREAGLLAERRSGTRRLYRARPEGLRELRERLRTFWDDALADLKQAAEYDTQQQHQEQSNDSQ